MRSAPVLIKKLPKIKLMTDKNCDKTKLSLFSTPADLYLHFSYLHCQSTCFCAYRRGERFRNKWCRLNFARLSWQQNWETK